MLVQAFKDQALVYEGRIRDNGESQQTLAVVREWLDRHAVNHDLITLFGGPCRRSESYTITPDGRFEKVTFRFAGMHQRIAASTRRPAPYQIPRSAS